MMIGVYVFVLLFSRTITVENAYNKENFCSLISEDSKRNLLHFYGKML